jgi:hypothetical protein
LQRSIVAETANNVDKAIVVDGNSGAVVEAVGEGELLADGVAIEGEGLGDGEVLVDGEMLGVGLVSGVAVGEGDGVGVGLTDKDAVIVPGPFTLAVADKVLGLSKVIESLLVVHCEKV